VAASGAATQAATAESFTLKLPKSASWRTITLSGAVTGTLLTAAADQLSATGLTSWLKGGEMADSWGAAVNGNTASCTISIPGYTDGKMTVTCWPKDDRSRTAVIITIIVTDAIIDDFEVRPDFSDIPVVRGEGYLVASSNVATTVSFATNTIGNNGTVDQAADWSFTASPAAGVSVSGAASSGVVTIPANYVGTINLSAAAAQNAEKSVSFTLNVGGLKAVISSIDEPYGTFVAGGAEWRVLSKTMGAGGDGTGTDVMIISEHLLGSAAWSDATGNYTDSDICNTELKNLYQNEMQWAHIYAVKPDFGVDDEAATKSTGAAVGNEHVRGCFLLSKNDVFADGKFGFIDNAGGYTPDQKRVATETTWDGDAAGWWLRGWDQFVDQSGAPGNTGAASDLKGIRPAMLLNID